MKEIIAFALNHYGCFDMYIWGLASPSDYIRFGEDEIKSCLENMLADDFSTEREKIMISKYLNQENSFSLVAA